MVDRKYSDPTVYDVSIDADDEPDGSEGGYDKHGNYVIPSAMVEIVQQRQRIAELEGLLKTAKCPDEYCNGNGTCAEQYWVNQETGDSDWRIWECRWCAERAALVPERGK